MKLSTKLVVALVIAVAAIAGLLAYPYFSAPQPSCTTAWACASPYPLQGGSTTGVAGEQCIADSPSVYCVGGADASGAPRDDVYTATVSATGNITSWRQEPEAYPRDVAGESCAAASGFLFCVGGIHDNSGDDLAESYYAELSSNGSFGAWRSATPYPVPVDSESCVALSSHVYCVGGNNETDGTESTVTPSSSVWFTSVNSSGMGEWVRTTPYPSGIFAPSCFLAGDHVYCIGGSNGNGDPLGTAYFAPVTAEGVGEWALTTSYPIASVGPSCVTSSGSIYCVGGETARGQPPVFSNAVYSAQISSGGIGTWQQGPSYPRSVGTSCVTVQGNAYCVGGFDESSVGLEGTVNYAPLSSIPG
ncbi:MAG TPA: hypothetical protein VLU91_05125 [Nitrososphaerales archaeon]|nr:hypothetical protein [Nitrososphaerales archaeon]